MKNNKNRNDKILKNIETVKQVIEKIKQFINLLRRDGIAFYPKHHLKDRMENYALMRMITDYVYDGL